jgi:hypothetical protein
MPCIDSNHAAESALAEEPSMEDCPAQPKLSSKLSDSMISGSPTESTCASSPVSESWHAPTSPDDVLRAKLEAIAIVAEDVELAQNFSDQVKLRKENAACRQMVMRMVRMLRLCDYESEVIIMILAVALVHLDTIFKVTDGRMEDAERVSIAVLQCFNSHCYVMDEACPMKYWQSNIYAGYCNVKVLNSAAFKLMKILKYKLSVTEEEVAAKRKILEN